MRFQKSEKEENKTMEESEKLYEQLQELEAAVPRIEEERKKAMEDPELHRLMVTLLLAERMLDSNDPQISLLQKELESRKEMINERTKAYREKQKTLSKELTRLTQPVIQKIVRELHERISSLKVERQILNKRYAGVSKQWILRVETNEGVVQKVRQKILEEIETIQSMSRQPIAAIQKEAALFAEGLKIFDLEKREQKEIDENTYFKGQTPQGLTGRPEYDGPRSGF
jgi:hypothetical protein